MKTPKVSLIWIAFSSLWNCGSLLQNIYLHCGRRDYWWRCPTGYWENLTRGYTLMNRVFTFSAHASYPLLCVSRSPVGLGCCLQRLLVSGWSYRSEPGLLVKKQSLWAHASHSWPRFLKSNWWVAWDEWMILGWGCSKFWGGVQCIRLNLHFIQELV